MNMKAIFSMFLCGALSCLAAGDEHRVLNTVAVRVNNQSISVLDVVNVYHDSYAVIQDRMKKGELNAANLEGAIRLAWKEALDTAVQDKILDQRAEKRKREIQNYILAQAGAVGL